VLAANSIPERWVNIDSVAVKLGVLFAKTLSGAILMDIEADRFIALTPVSALMWDCFVRGYTVPQIIDKIATEQAVDRQSAEGLFIQQLWLWERVQLVNAGQSVIALPLPKPSSPMPSAAELWPDSIRLAPLDLRLIAFLYLAEMKYRRALVKVGLARTLKALQAEHGPQAESEDLLKLIARTVRSYLASRRIFKQGSESRDCLLRSLAVAAVLRRQGVDADLCIGIIDMPFSAHAWVEAGGYLLTDSVHKCRHYRVIGRF
jgi:hypothetical protein